MNRRIMPGVILLAVAALVAAACFLLGLLSRDYFPAQNSGATSTEMFSSSEPYPPSVQRLTPTPTPEPTPEPTPIQLDPSAPPGRLQLASIPFVYNSLCQIENGNDPNHAISVLLRFPYLVCNRPGLLHEKELLITDTIKYKVRIFGYMYMGGTPLPSLEKLKTQLGEIKAQGWYGVFIDQFGYDFDETRLRQNEVVGYAHQLGLICFVNCWNLDDAFSNDRDPRHNPAGATTRLQREDWMLLESFFCSNVAHEPKEDLIKRALLAKRYKEIYGVRIAALSYKIDQTAWNTAAVDSDIRNSCLLSLLMNFDGWWFTDRLESNAFFHGEPVGLNFGDALTRPFSAFSPSTYDALTDRYRVLLDLAGYPEVKVSIYRNLQ